MKNDEKEKKGGKKPAKAKAGESAATKPEAAAADSAKREAHAGDAPATSGAHGHAKAHVNRKEYWVIFAVLFVLTVLEVGVAKLPGIGKSSMVLALVGLAVTKAAFVALFYMHLKHETKILKATVAFPLVFPALYAVVLSAEAVWRMTR